MPPSDTALRPDSFTAQRLSHATPEHLYITTRRCFVGPVPEGWLKSHRRDWYKHHLNLHYSSRSATFHTSSNVSHTRRLSGLDGPSSSATYQQSFRQPEDLGLDPESQTEDADEGNQVISSHVTLSRSSEPNSEIRQVDGPTDREDEIIDEALPLDQTDTSTSSEIQGGSLHEQESASYNNDEAGASGAVKDQGESSVRPLNASPKGIVASGTAVKADHHLTAGSSGFDSRASAASTKSLLEHKEPSPVEGGDVLESAAPAPEGRFARALQQTRTLRDSRDDDVDASKRRQLVSFAVPEASRRRDLYSKAATKTVQVHRSASGLFKAKTQFGLIVKMEKMVVRVDFTSEKPLPDDFDENSGQGIVTRTKEKWREFMVVCRSVTYEDATFVLQMYKTRVIPTIQDRTARKRYKYEVTLDKRYVHVNLYSSLDKSLVIWTPAKRGTDVYILRPKSSANSVEWYTFLRNILGWRRTQELTVNVPDLNISLSLTNPFKEIEAIDDFDESGELDEEAVRRTIDQEQAVASNIVRRCLEMLDQDHGWTDIISMWTANERIGLAWKRYDRLEWIHGANERKMYGTIAMMKSHDLELRPKSHAPTTTHDRKGRTLSEPPPVEGFLICLTSHKGVHQKMGKLFYKRLYFSTQNQFLIFSRPANAHPPPPPKLPVVNGSSVPDAHTIAQEVPLIYAVNPFPVKDSQIAWLSHSQHPNVDIPQHDEDAYDEAERNLNVVLDCDGYIDLTHVRKVRKIHRGATPADVNIDEGSDVDFDEEVDDTAGDDGATESIDDERCFELVLDNGLVIRLQAFNKLTKIEWKKRLRELVRYWKHHSAAEMELFRTIRKRNLDELKVDEDTEAIVGQFAKKWEVAHTYASPLLYNMCGISCCRTVLLSGELYRKPRLHSSFLLGSCLLVSGHLLIFSPSLRSTTGRQIPTIHHGRQNSLDLDLSTCYLYSGLLTENDLINTNKAFDSSRPGRSGLHRWYADDAWRVSDEDAMCTFVLWYQRRKEWLRIPGTSDNPGKTLQNLNDQSDNRQPQSQAVEDGSSGSKRARLKRVSQLGVKGRSIVFKARSRAERDRWVLALSTEIDRLAVAEDVRLTTDANIRDMANSI